MKFLRMLFVFLACAVLTYAAQLPMRLADSEKPSADASIRCTFVFENGEYVVFAPNENGDAYCFADGVGNTSGSVICADETFFREMSKYIGKTDSLNALVDALGTVSGGEHITAVSQAVYPNIVTTLSRDEFTFILTALKLYRD